MAALVCDVCGGKLVMGTGGIAVCDSCGMEHSKDRMQEKVQEIKGTVEVSNIAGIESLMTHAYLALEDSKWGAASDEYKKQGYFDRVLDIDPKYAPAYIGKLCADISKGRWEGKNDLFAYVIHKEEDLARYYKPLDDMPNYQKAIRFADDAYRAKLEGYNNEIKKRLEELKKDYAFYMVIESVFTSQRPTYTSSGTGYGIGSISLRGTCCVEKKEGDCQFKIQGKEAHYPFYGGKGPYEFRFTPEEWKKEIINGKDYDFKSGDVAVITHEMLKEEEQRRIEEKRRKEQKEQKERERVEAEKRQQEQWQQQGLCEYCGGQLGGVFSKKCKSCGKENKNK